MCIYMASILSSFYEKNSKFPASFGKLRLTELYVSYSSLNIT